MRKLMIAILAVALALIATPAWAAPEFELRQFTPYEDSEGNWRARGIIKNIGNEWGYSVRVEADLHDRQTGQLVESAWGHANGEVVFSSLFPENTTEMGVAPGQWVTFDFDFSKTKYAEVDYRNARIVFTRLRPSQTRAADANPVVTEWNQFQDEAGMWQGSGKVVNQGSRTANYVRIRCQLFSFKDEALGHHEDNYFYIGNLHTLVTVTKNTNNNGSPPWDISSGEEGIFDTRLGNSEPYPQTPVPFAGVRHVRHTIVWQERSASSSN